MPLPAGFVEEHLAYAPQVSNLPPGFVEEGKTVPEIKQAPKSGAFDTVINFFKDPDRQTAKAQNIYALSEVTGLPLHEVNKNYEILKKSSEVTGITRELDKKEFMQMVMLPGVALGATVNPVGTAAGLIAYGALDKAIPTQKLIDHLGREGISENATGVIEMADLIGKSMLVGGVFSRAPKIAEGFLKSKITEYKMPETVSLSATQVRDIFQTGSLTTEEQKGLFAALELNSFDRRAALEHGINITVPAEKVVTLTDKPWWGKVKNWFGVEPTAETLKTPSGSPKIAPKGLIEGQTGEAATLASPKTDPVKTVISALKSAKDVRKQQETLYEKARSEKFAKMQAVGGKVGGEKGLYARLGALKGELPKVEFEAIRNKVSQEDIDALFNMVRESPKIGEWEKLSAMQGLSKMFGEYGGRVPTEGELALLNEVFGDQFTQAILEKRSLFQKMKDAGLQLANVPRSLMASLDLSAPMRQGVFFVGRPKQFIPAFKKMFGAFANEKAYQDIQDAIIKHPDYQLARDSKLALTDNTVLLGTREEAFMSNWAERIPLIGKMVKASERAYVGFLNKLRFDVFADLVNKAELQGLDPRTNRDLTKAIADFINNATGRGTLPGALQKAAVNLNTIFFSPRLIMSRLNLVNPHFYIKQTPFVRKEALKSLLAFLGFGIGVATLAKLGGAEVGNDPRSSDFGKIKIGNTRVDPWGGFQQVAVMASRLISGKYVSSTTGKEMTLGEGYKPMTRADIAQRFLEGKLAPVPSFIVTLLKGQDGAGEKVSVPKEVAQRFIPMILQDLYDIAQEAPGLLPVGMLGLFGVGTQTYKAKDYR